MLDNLFESLSQIREKKPIILCLTNSVTKEFVANGLLAIGASPIMSSCEKEIEELLFIADALYINIGTLSDEFITLTQKATQIAIDTKKRIVLDPVGSGASTIRTSFTKELLSKVNIIRGNSGEILSLADQDFLNTGGIDSSFLPKEALHTAKHLTKKYHQTIIISGQEDFIVSPQKILSVDFGSSIMTSVTGMGCTLSAIVTAFCAVLANDTQAGYLATLYFGLVGELAAKSCLGPASFKTQFLDSLFQTDKDSLLALYNQKK